MVLIGSLIQRFLLMKRSLGGRVRDAIRNILEWLFAPGWACAVVGEVVALAATLARRSLLHASWALSVALAEAMARLRAAVTTWLITRSASRTARMMTPSMISMMSLGTLPAAATLP